MISFFSPENETVSSFIGSSNILKSDSCRQLVPGLMEVTCGEMHIVLPHDEGNIEKIAISPRDVYISDVLPAGPAVNRYMGTIISIKHDSTTAKIEVNTGGLMLKAEIPVELASEMNLEINKEIYVILRLRRLKVLSNKENPSPSVLFSNDF